MRLYFEKDQKFYEIYVAHNLLGDIQLTRRYGRIGTFGRQLHEICGSWGELKSRLKKLSNHRTIVRGYKKLSSY